MTRIPPRARPVAAAALVLCGSVSVQYSAALASGLFASVGTLGVSGLRMVIAAVVLLAIARPRLRGRTRREWLAIILYGLAMAAMNVLFYNAVANMPLGLATTLEFLGPLGVAAITTARRWELILPAITLAGVVLISRPGGGMTVPGLLFGLGAAVAFGAYTLLAARIGGSGGGIQGLSLSVAVAAVPLLPFSVLAVPHVPAPGWLPLVASALLGVALAYACDFIAASLTSARVVGTLFSIDPVVGAVTGALVLGEVMTIWTIVGIVLVAASGGVVVALAGRERRTPPPAPSPARD
jgi:inner membrane transporter RhtA